MPSLSLPQPPFRTAKVLSLSRDEDVLWGCTVWCPFKGCTWHQSAKDATDALAILEGHYADQHSEQEH